MEDVDNSDMDAVEELLRQKWFWPIFCRLDVLEERFLEVMPVLRHILIDDSPDWSFACFHYAARVDGDVNGFCDTREIRARGIGRMIGAKCALSDAMRNVEPNGNADT